MKKSNPHLWGIFYLPWAYFFVAILWPLHCNLLGIIGIHGKRFVEIKHATPRVGDTLGKRVYVYSVTWVRIPLSPHPFSIDKIKKCPSILGCFLL